MTEFFNLDPILATLAARASLEDTSLFCVVTATEAEAQQVLKGVLSLGGNSLAADDVLYFPGFVQAGVFRYESARRVLAQRVAALHKLSTHTPRIIIASVTGFSRIIPELNWIRDNALHLQVEQSCDIDPLVSELKRRDYTLCEKVEDIGDFSIRGGIVDIWSPGQKFPTRLEFFGDTLEKIRVFRKGDQRSFDVLKSLNILPMREFVWAKNEATESTIHKINQYILNQGVAGRNRSEILENIRYGVPFPGIDDLASTFESHQFQSLHKLIANIAQSASKKIIPVFCATPKAISSEIDSLKRLYNTSTTAQHQKNQAAALLETVFPNFEFLENASYLEEHFHCPFFLPENLHDALSKGGKTRFANRMAILSHLLETKAVDHFLILCHSNDSFLETHNLLGKYFRVSQLNSETQSLKIFEFSVLNTRATSALRFADHFSAAIAHTNHFFFDHVHKTLVISELWLHGSLHDHSIETFSDQESQQASREASVALMATQFGDFAEGDLVVHVQHGIARFLGLTTVSVGNSSADFLALEYAGNDKVYVPVNKMNLIQRYVGASKDDTTCLDSLKSTAWEKRKAKAKADAEKLAKELMEHQAKRATTPGHGFSTPAEDYLDFEAAFPYDETEDQLKAVREIMSDMSKTKSMDRLLVGDVGFGKTEVAMRAAFRAVLDGKQVAWLVPTTVLAHQHARSLRERFADFGAKICLLDRSLSAKSERELLENIQSGNQDIIIGTHRLLSKDIAFKNLGLLVVDEEHRFGVVQKERIKQISYGIDVLNMTATPIPRTLQMAMIGLRDLSLITTPPKARLAVKTFVSPYDEAIIRDAINDELMRGGQVFFVHNKVEDLPSIQEYILKIVPKAKVGIGHGQMSQKELDKTIIDFLDQKSNVLLCTTIIESGIDMPNVNTIIIQDADQFGLAQLYQLRGRVGRRASRGYAFFLMSEGIDEEGEGMRRLNILRDHQELGSGFIIASHDLEMRGAGNILGDEQSGRMSDVGLETYTQMLDDAIRSLGGIKVRATHEAEINIPAPYQIPENYIQNSKERLRTYRRFFAANTEDQLLALLSECEDRFGPIPQNAQSLAEVSRLRRWLVRINAASLNVTGDCAEIRMNPDIFQPSDDGSNEVLVKRILTICNMPENRIRLTPDGRILLPVPSKTFIPDASKGFALLKRLLSQLANEAPPQS